MQQLSFLGHSCSYQLVSNPNLLNSQQLNISITAKMIIVVIHILLPLLVNLYGKSYLKNDNLLHKK